MVLELSSVTQSACDALMAPWDVPQTLSQSVALLLSSHFGCRAKTNCKLEVELMIVGTQLAVSDLCYQQATQAMMVDAKLAKCHC